MKKNFTNTKMVEGILVKYHVVNMISYVNELNALREEIDADYEVYIILASLPHFQPVFHEL